MSESYSVKQLEDRLQFLKGELRYSGTKTIIELVVSTFFLAYFWRASFDWTSSPAYAIPLIINCATWIIWIAYRFRAAVNSRYAGFERSRRHLEDDWEDYRMHEYSLRIVRRREALFDMLFGLQFALAAGLIVASYGFRF